MRYWSLFLGLFLLTGVAGSQWLESTIRVPNADIEIETFATIGYNPINNHVYICAGDGEGVQVIDADTRSRLYCLDSAGWYPNSIIFCLDRNRIYIPCMDRLLFINAQNDSLVGFRPLDGFPRAAYDSREHKVYVGTDDEPALYVFDVGPDTLLRRIDLTDGIGRIAWDSTSNRVFLRSEDSTDYGIVAIDCGTDTVVDHVRTGLARGGDMLLDEPGRQLYVHGENPETELGEIWVYGLDSLNLRATIPVPDISRENGNFCLNRQARLLYLGDWYHQPADVGDTLVVIDCESNTIWKRIGLPEWANCMKYNEQNGKLYVGLDYSVAVLAVPDSITVVVPTNGYAFAVGWGPPNGDVYVSGEGTVTVLSGDGDSLITSYVCDEMNVRSLAWTAAGDRLYGSCGPGITIVGRDNRVESQLTAPRGAGWTNQHPAWCPELNRLYTTRAYLDCNTDSFHALRLPRAAVYPPFYVPEYHKLYFLTDSGLTMAYDIYSDSVGREFGKSQPQFVCNPRNGLVYGFHVNTMTQWPEPRESLCIVDPARDTLLAKLDWGRWTRTVLNTTENELYCTYTLGPPSRLLVLDASTNAVTDTIELPARVYDLAWYEPLDKLYAVGESTVYAVDCKTRSIVKSIAVGPGHTGSDMTVLSPRNDKLWVCSRAGTDVIQCRLDSVVARFDVATKVAPVWNPLDNRTYVSDGATIWVFRDNPVDVDADAADAPARLSLTALPNPIRDAATFDCAVPGSQPGRLVVFDLTGRTVWEHAVAGGMRSHLVWPCSDANGRALPSGVYFAQLQSGRGCATAKLVIR